MNILPHTGTKPTIVTNKAKYIRTAAGCWIVNDLRQIYIYIYIYIIYENSTVELASVGLTQARPKYFITLVSMHSYCTCGLHFYLPLTRENTMSTRAKTV